MPWEDWKRELIYALARAFGEPPGDVARWVDDGEDSYREMFDDGLSPADACSEECDAAAWMASQDRSSYQAILDNSIVEYFHK